MTGNDAERGEQASSGPTCLDCANGTCICDCETCSAWRERRSSLALTADDRDAVAIRAENLRLRELLRLALGKLRDVQRADVTGTVNEIELALDGATKGA